MSDKNNDKALTGHVYDGIEELDNQLPNWWLIIFTVTVIWGFYYWLHYSIAGGRTQAEEYADKMQKIQELRAQGAATSGGAGAAVDLEALIGNADAIQIGKSVFETNCASCHGRAGEGSIGPNLTDNFWIHGRGKALDIEKVVLEGSLAKGMPAWGTLLSRDKIDAAVVYVISLKGSNPANPKAPEGTEVNEP